MEDVITSWIFRGSAHKKRLICWMCETHGWMVGLHMGKAKETPTELVLDGWQRRKLPIGAEKVEGRIDFSVWAPDCREAELVIEQPEAQVLSMSREKDDRFHAMMDDPQQPVLYRFRLDGKEPLLPDPASRFQPQGPEGPSEVIDPSLFAWTDQNWPGVRLEGQVIYEMHVGTFTPQGDWLAAARQLPELAGIGISVIELMPIADFPGRFGWGYDGVNLFAPSHLYGRPDDLRRFVDTAHGLGIAVILDVVYNHLGPEGNFLPVFSRSYLTDRYECEWGEAINFDGPGSQPVREFYIANASHWIEEYHFDGFRLDATQQIFDQSRPGILAEIVENARRVASGRQVLIIGENEPQRVELLNPANEGGADFDALWNDDFHHAMLVALTGRAEAYYSDYRGTPQEIVSVARHGFLYQGQRSRWQEQPRGTSSSGVPPARLVCYIENHDQVANSAWGHRIGRLTSPGRHRAATALLLLGPWTPMVFQGQEYAATTPFVFFADHKEEIARLTAQGRREFLSQFPGVSTEAMQRALMDPAKEETFQLSKLDFRQREQNARFYAMFKDLVSLRKTDAVFSLQGQLGIDGAVLSERAFVLRFFGHEADRILIVNLGSDLYFGPVSEPLLAPPRDRKWRMLFSTEDPTYGGSGTAEVILDDGWRIAAESAAVFASEMARA
jgi:maltooligosyltrehalose trehalohydrolase